MNKDFTNAWILQAKGNEWSLDKHLNEKFEGKKTMYFTTNQHAKEINLGDIAFVWRAGVNQGIVAMGKVIKKPRPRGEIHDILEEDDEDDPNNETNETLKVGIELYDVHTADDQSSLLREEILKHPILKEIQVFKGQRGTVFPIDDEYSDLLCSILKRKKWRMSAESKPLPNLSQESLPLKFKFEPKPPPKELKTSNRSSVESFATSYEHRTIQNKLYDNLCKNMGKENVACEHTIGEKKADIIVQIGDSFDIYEIKTSSCPRECIKEALGQLLDYAYYEPKFKDSCGTLWVVGKNREDEKTSEYIDHLKEKYSLPIDYHSQPID